MVLFTLILLIVIILVVFSVVVIAATGAVGAILFSDVFVCIIFLVWLLRRILKKRK